MHHFYWTVLGTVTAAVVVDQLRRHGVIGGEVNHDA